MVVIQNVPHLIEVYSKSGRRGRKIKGAQLGLRHSTAARIGKTLLSCLKMLAEGARFELADRLPHLRFSRPARSATPSPLHIRPGHVRYDDRPMV